jgi:hypothetical protein
MVVVRNKLDSVRLTWSNVDFNQLTLVRGSRSHIGNEDVTDSLFGLIMDLEDGHLRLAQWCGV